MKKFLVLLIMLIAAIMLTSAAADEPTVYTSGDYKYVLLEDGTAEITKYTGEASELTIPAELDGHRVTAIGDDAFYLCDSLTSITIPDSVTSIDEWAFSGCGSLTSITIPDSVTSIGTNPFPRCSRLTSIRVSPDHPTLATIDGVLFEKATKTLICYPCAFSEETYTIPQGIRVIGDRAFIVCDSLTSLTIPDSVTTIGYSAFAFCDSLTSLTIPDSVTTIGDSAFGGCTALTSITIPRSITAIDDGAFTDVLYLPALTDIYVSDDHPTLASVDGVLFDKSTNTLLCFPCASDITNYVIPQETRIIGDEAFYDCDTLTSITIPDSVTTIGDRAFYHCSNLTSITIPDSVTSIGNNAFGNCRSLTSITVGRDSYARQYCIDNGLSYTYPDANDWLLN